MASTQAFVASRTDRPRLHFAPGGPETVSGVSSTARGGDGWAWAWTFLFALLAAGGVRALLLRRPAARETVLSLDRAIHFDPIEAELQEILAQEEVRQEDPMAEAPAGR